MSKDSIVNFRVSSDTYDHFKKKCFQLDVNPSDYLRDCMESFVKGSGVPIYHNKKRVTTNELFERLEALEAKFKSVIIDDKEKYRVSPRPPRRELFPDKELKDPDSLSDLITLNEMVAMTGYAKGTLSPKLSRMGIKASKRIDGNRTGLYDKEEILREVGINPNL